MLLVARAITKRFGATRAVGAADLAIAAGQVHAVVGENGAGKSTLLKICAGVLAPDEGDVIVDGAPLAPHDAATALGLGVALVQQHLALIGTFTGIENVILGVEPLGRGPLPRLDLRAARPKIAAIAADLGWNVPLDTRTDLLGLADRQRIAIVRALYRDARVLILDEPTAVLTPGESDQLYRSLRRLAASSPGRAVVVVTHKLDEVLEHADVATVMRRGSVRGHLDVERTERRSRESMKIALVKAVMGDDPPPPLEPRTRALGHVVLTARDVHLDTSLRGVSFELRASEIVGIAGVDGNGQRELVDVLAGRAEADHGAVITRAKASPATAFEDRQREGLVLDASIADNAVLGELARFTRLGVLDLAALDEEAGKRLGRARAKVDVAAPARVLSGGNQQKIVIGRALARVQENAGSRRTDVLLVAHPTRGVDLGSSRVIHAEIARAADEGAGVIIVSADLAELRMLADRCLVMVRGRVVRELAASASDAEYGEAMLEGT